MIYLMHYNHLFSKHSFLCSRIKLFVNIKILSSSFIPHIIVGYGFSKFSDGIDRSGFFPSTETSRTFFGGVGFSFPISESLAINLQSTYRNMNENTP